MFNVKRFAIALFCLLCGLRSFAQQDTTKTSTTEHLITFSGYALTADSLMGVPFAHVTILNRGRLAQSGPDGFFSFAAHPGDTLIFTCIGFQTSQYVIPKQITGDKFSVIHLMSHTDYYMKDVIIWPWGDREGFKQAFRDLRLPDDDLQRAKRNLERETLAELGKQLEMDGGEATHMALMNNSAKTYYYKQTPSQNIFNPLAWAEFIRAWKNGDFKKK